MRVLTAIIMLALLLAVTVSPASAVTAEAGFIIDNAQLLVLGELVSVDALENDDFSTSDIEAFFYVDVKGTGSELDMQIKMHIEFSSLGQIIYESWTMDNHNREPSDQLTIRKWMDSPIGDNGYYTNDKFDELESQTWFDEDVDRSTDFNAETLTEVIDGANLAGGIYIIKVEVFEDLPGNGTIDRPVATAIAPIQVASPSRPQPITPQDNDDVNGYPIFISWTGVGAQVLPMDVNLVLVESDPDNFDDPQTVIDNRNAINTRFDGIPQFSDYHVYTGVSGNEQALTSGMTYVWMVTVGVTSAGGQLYEYRSSPVSFVFNDGGLFGGDGELDGEDEGLGGVAAGDGFVNNPPREADSNEPIPDPVFTLLLQSGLTQEQVNAMIRAFEGFYVQDIMFDGQNGQTYPTLAQKLNTVGLEVIAVDYEGEE